MTELSPSARALLDAARDGLSPDAAAADRVRAKLAAGVGGGAAAAGAKLALVGKLAIVAVVAGVAGAAYLLTREPAESAPVSIPIPPPHDVSAAVSNSPRSSVSTTAGSTTPAAPSAVKHATSPNTSTVSTPHVAATTPHIAPASVKPKPRGDDAVDGSAIEIEPPAKGTELAREVAIIDRAMAALRRGDAGEALDAIRLYDRETLGGGQLAEDAAAIAVEALCQRGDAAAGAKLDAFDKRWPHSAQRARLQAACHR